MRSVDIEQVRLMVTRLIEQLVKINQSKLSPWPGTKEKMRLKASRKLVAVFMT